jgi:hypothetical protein
MILDLSSTKSIFDALSTLQIVCSLSPRQFFKPLYMITNLDSVIDIASKQTLSTLTFIKACDASLNYNLSKIKTLALLFIRLCLKASQASLLGLNHFSIYFSVLINL